MMTEVDKDTIGQLDETIHRAVDRYADLHKLYREILEEKKELEALCSEQERRIEGLQLQVENLKKNTDHEALNKYHQKETQIKQRIQSMLSRFEDLDQLEQS